MMPRTETFRQPHVCSASLNSDTRGIYFAATGFPPDNRRNSGGDRRSLRMRRRRPESCGDTCRSPFIFSDDPRSRDSRGPNARRRCYSRSRASSSVRLAGHGRIFTEPREPRPQRAARISRPVTRYRAYSRAIASFSSMSGTSRSVLIRTQAGVK